ncbi:MAG: PAS domain-containing protein, partial [Mucilaginibacter sp.]
NLQMELAHKYLVEKKCNKSQMAVMLNFANPSNFSVCYSKYLTKNATKELITNIKKESDERYKTFIRQVPATIAMLDNDLCYLAASLNWIKYYRLQNKEFIGKNFYDLHPGSKSIYGKRLSECLKGKIDNCDEALIEKLDGSRAWLRWDFRPWYNVDNEIGGLIMLTEDLTASKLKDEEHKQISAILNKTSEISRIGTWQRNFETEDGTWSPVLKEIMEVPDDFVPPDMSTTYNFYKEGPHRDLVKMVIKYALEKGQEFDIETEIITAKGNSKKVRIIGYPELINGKCEKISGIFQELTNHLIIS